LKNSGNSTVTVTPTQTNNQTSTLTNTGGNSQNTNTLNAQGGGGGAGGQGGQATSTSAGGSSNQQQTATSSAANNGNNSNNSTTTINEAKIPVNTAYAPTALPTMGCFKGFGAGVQTAQAGVSFGGGKVDENCERLEVARSYGIAGSWDAYCRVMITNKYSKEAGVTFADCMKRVTEVPAPPPAPPAPAPQQPQVIILQQPAPVAAVPPPSTSAPIQFLSQEPVDTKRLVGVCTFGSPALCQVQGKTFASTSNGSGVTSVCKEMLTAAAQELKLHPNDILYVVGNRNASESENLATIRSHNVRNALVAKNINVNQIVVQEGNAGTRTVELWVGPAYTVHQ
jgi:hypothetical protein